MWRDIDIDVALHLALGSSYMGFEESVVLCHRVATSFCDVWFAIAAVRSVDRVVCRDNVVLVCSLHIWGVLLDVRSGVGFVVGLDVWPESGRDGVGRMTNGGGVWGGDWRAPEKHRVKRIPGNQPIDRTCRISISRIDEFRSCEKLCRTYRPMRFNVLNPPPVTCGPGFRVGGATFLWVLAGGLAGSTAFVPFFVPYFDAAMPFFFVKLAMVARTTLPMRGVAALRAAGFGAGMAYRSPSNRQTEEYWTQMMADGVENGGLL